MPFKDICKNLRIESKAGAAPTEALHLLWLDGDRKLLSVRFWYEDQAPVDLTVPYQECARTPEMKQWARDVLRERGKSEEEIDFIESQPPIDQQDNPLGLHPEVLLFHIGTYLALNQGRIPMSCFCKEAPKTSIDLEMGHGKTMHEKVKHTFSESEINEIVDLTLEGFGLK
jgi:hypothetical protein